MLTKIQYIKNFRMELKLCLEGTVDLNACILKKKRKLKKNQ